MKQALKNQMVLVNKALFFVAAVVISLISQQDQAAAQTDPNTGYVVVFEKPKGAIDSSKFDASKLFDKNTRYNPNHTYKINFGTHDAQVNPELIHTISPNFKDIAAGKINNPVDHTEVNISEPVNADGSATNGHPTLESLPPSYLRQLRDEINFEKAKAQQQAQIDGPVKSTFKKFVPESLTFFLAGGFIYWMELNAITGGDPEAMVRHLEAQKDPIAHLSFGIFMLANRLSVNGGTKYFSSRYQKEELKAKLGLLNKMAMGAGAFASAVFSDLAYLAKDCGKKWAHNKPSEETIAACDNNWKEFTIRNKTNQYSSNILGLITTITVIHKTTEGIKNKVLKPLNDKTKFTSFVSKKEEKLLKFLKVDSAKIKLQFSKGVSGGIFSFAVKSIVWAGSFTNFVIFLKVEHAIKPLVERPFNNLVLPSWLVTDQKLLNTNISLANKNGWNLEDQNSDFAKNEKDGPEWSEPNLLLKAGIELGLFTNKMVEGIKNFTSQMTKYRAARNSVAEANLNLWNTTVTKLFNQKDYAHAFYQNYINAIHETKKNYYKKKYETGTVNHKEIEKYFHNHPFRSLPLYGVKTDHDFKNENEDDLYVNKPYALERIQSEFLRRIAQAQLQKLDEEFDYPSHLSVSIENKQLFKWEKRKLDTKKQEKTKSFIEKLVSEDPVVQGRALQAINGYIISSGVYFIDLDKDPFFIKDNFTLKNFKFVYFDKEIAFFLNQFREKLGNPRPLFVQGTGIAAAHEINTDTKAMSESADFPKSNVLSKLKLTYNADYLTYMMVCGQDFPEINHDQEFSPLKGEFEAALLGINFLPPKITVGSRPEKFCEKLIMTSADLYTEPIEHNGRKYANITHFIYQNINPKFLGDITKNDNENEQGKFFAEWWEGPVYNELLKSIAILAKSYEINVKETYHQIFDSKSIFDISKVSGVKEKLSVFWDAFSDQVLDLPLKATKIFHGAQDLDIADVKIEDNLYFENEFYIYLLESYLNKSTREAKSLSEIHIFALENKEVPIDFNETESIEDLKKRYSPLVILSEIDPTQITTINDFFEQVMTKSNAILSETMKLDPPTEILKEIQFLNDLSKKLDAEMTELKLKLLKFSMRNALLILKKPVLSNEDISQMTNELQRANSGLFAALESKKAEVLNSKKNEGIEKEHVKEINNGIEEFPLGDQLLWAIYEGFQSLQSEVTRYATMKVPLQARFRLEGKDAQQLLKTLKSTQPTRNNGVSIH